MRVVSIIRTLRRLTPGFMLVSGRGCALARGISTGLTLGCSLVFASAVQAPVVRGAVAADASDSQPSTGSGREKLIVVVGAAGAEEFEGEFLAWGEAWQSLGERNQWDTLVVHEPTEPEQTPLQQLQLAVADHAERSERLWIVMLGHGTYTNGIAKFNLVGPDVSASELKRWLQPLRSEVIVVNCSSASAPFLPELSKEGRIVITATRSGTEINYSRFGKYLAESLTDLAVDIDHDESVSLLEAFLAASVKTDRFYRDGTRLATEHALLDDNFDRVGTSGDFYQGIRPLKSAKEGQAVDGSLAARVILFASDQATLFPPQLAAQRAEIERAIERLRGQKPAMDSASYYNALELLMLQLSQLYSQAEALPEASSETSAEASTDAQAVESQWVFLENPNRSVD